MIRSVLTTVAVLMSTSVGYGVGPCDECTKKACSDEGIATHCMHACSDKAKVEECMSALPQDKLGSILSRVTAAKAADGSMENTDAPAAAHTETAKQ